MKISLKERLAYGCGDLGSQFAFNMTTTYMLVFFTDVVGLSAAAAGMVMLIAMIFDAINDPIIGSIADRTKTKIGSYRPYMAAAAIPYAIFLVLCFTVPNVSYVGKLVWAYAMHLIFTVASTCFQMPYGSLTNVMTDDPQERVVLGTFRDWGANLAGFLLNLFAITIITKFSRNGGMDQHGYFALAVVVGGLTAILCLISFAGTKERIRPERNTTKLLPALKSVLQNKPALRLLGMVFFINFLVAFKGTFTTYYGIYYLGDPNMIALILTTMFTLPLIGLFFVPKLNQIFGGRKMFIISGVCAILCGVFSLIARTNTALVVVSAVFAGLTVSGIFANIWGNMPNAADFGEWKTGVRAPGLVYGLATFAIKLAGAFAAYGISGILALSGYQAGLEVQSAAVNSAMYWSNGIVPIVGGIIAIVIIWGYDLNDGKMETVRTELEARRQQKEDANGSIA